MLGRLTCRTMSATLLVTVSVFGCVISRSVAYWILIGPVSPKLKRDAVWVVGCKIAPKCGASFWKLGCLTGKSTYVLEMYILVRISHQFPQFSQNLILKQIFITSYYLGARNRHIGWGGTSRGAHTKCQASVLSQMKIRWHYSSQYYFDTLFGQNNPKFKILMLYKLIKSC